MGFLMDSEGTGELHIKQKQRAVVFIYISQTQSEIPVHFATDVSKILWVSQNSDFFSSFSKDSVMRMNDARKDSHASNPALCVFWMIAIVAIQGWLSYKFWVMNVCVCAYACVGVSHFIF